MPLKYLYSSCVYAGSLGTLVYITKYTQLQMGCVVINSIQVSPDKHACRTWENDTRTALTLQSCRWVNVAVNITGEIPKNMQHCSKAILRIFRFFHWFHLCTVFTPKIYLESCTHVFAETVNFVTVPTCSYYWIQIIIMIVITE